MKLKIVTSVFLVISLIANVALYSAARLANDVLDSQIKIVEVVESLVKNPPPNLSKIEVLKRVKTIYPKSKIEVGENLIIFSNAKLYFEDDVYWGSSYK